MDRKRLLELAGVPVTEANDLESKTKEIQDKIHAINVELISLEQEFGDADKDKGEQKVDFAIQNMARAHQFLADIIKRHLAEASGDSKMSDGMTGEEFDFEMEPDYITILKNNKDTGVTIPIDNWDKMIGAYNRIINKKHNY